MTLGGVVRLIIVGVVSRGSALRLGPLALGPQRANVVESRHGRVAVRVAVRLASKTGEVPPADTTYTVFEGLKRVGAFSRLSRPRSARAPDPARCFDCPIDPAGSCSAVIWFAFRGLCVIAVSK